jgi:hypothetical protein
MALTTVRLNSIARASSPASSQGNPTGRRKLGGTLRSGVRGGTWAIVEIVSVEVPLPETDEGENVQVAPTGRPLQLRLTVPVNPFRAPIVSVEVPELPAVTGMLVGLAEKLKSGVVVTVMVTAVEVEVA